MAKLKQPKLIKLDLSYGQLPQGHAYERIPKLDPMKFPWPLKNESVEEAFSGYLFQRIPKHLRLKFMEELWRVLIPKGIAKFVVPYWSSPRAFQDATAEWPPITEQSFFYYSKQWLEAQNEKNGQKCDFEFPPAIGYALEQDTVSRNDETRPFWMKHYISAINDLHVTLTKRT